MFLSNCFIEQGRALADLTDRHYSLFANNQHPVQLDIYQNYNKMLRIVHSEEHQTRINDTHERFKELVAEKTKHLNHEEGETISFDDFQDIYIQAKAEEREKYNFMLNTKNKTGDIADYLEARRPFGASAQWGVAEWHFNDWIVSVLQRSPIDVEATT